MIRLEVEYDEPLFNVNAFHESWSASIGKMAEATKDFWTTIAGQRLKSSRLEYQESIKLEGTKSDSFTVALDGGFLPWALEVGTGTYPMALEKGKIAPLNVNREIIFTSPQVWVTGTGEPWNHPGFPGFNMRNDVVEELTNTIVPKHIEEAFSKV
jgi:hypothetical protein